ncbi:MAG: serine hydroxymethyltransferase [Dehalococcoidia bacterium]|nr:serine hydroxymethyltransferase [Dehalococcoidia bacterium]
MPLYQSDPELAALITKENERQSSTIDLIASENHVDSAILAAQASLLTDKYAEGYPGRRYYNGCSVVDEVEELVISRAKALFGAEYANVQPHAGSQANFAAYQAFIEPGATVLGMDRSHGGHLTHGASVNFSGKLFHSVSYQVDPDTELIDYDIVRRMAHEHRPALIIAGASSYPRIIDFAIFGEIAREVDAKLMVDMAHIAGLIAGGVHPSPVPHADVITGTTQKTLRGPRGGMILSRDEYGKKIDSAVFPGSQGGPLLHVIAAKGTCFLQAMRPEFRDYAQAIVANARAMAETIAEDGLRVVSGGTDNHLVLVDLSALGITGKDAGMALERAGIVANKNSIPYDTIPPALAGGLRVGTPAITTRGFNVDEARTVAHLVCRVLRNPESEQVRDEVRRTVSELCESHPIPGLL